jgi:phage repressor protein C with HTH and peptisase S24 domain
MPNWTPEEEAAHLQARFAGVRQAEFARTHNVPGGASMLSQHIKGRRPLNLEAAIAYAKGFGVSLDQISPRLANEVRRSQTLTKAEDAVHMYSESTTDRDLVHIPQYEAGGAMGHSLVLQGDQPGIIRHMAVTQEWAQKNLKSHTGLHNLCIVTGFGDSMKPMYNPGDPLILDQGINAVYFFRVEGFGFIKRLQIIPGEGIRVISENKKYEPWTIKRDADFQIFGRVMKAWCSEDL